MPDLRIFLKYNLGPILWAIFILIIFFIPSRTLPSANLPAVDKFVHFLCFFVLSYLLTIGQTKQFRFSLYRYKVPFRCLLICLAFGLMTETGQAFLTTRSAEFFDVVANSLGAFVGYCYFMIFLYKAKGNTDENV